MLSAGNRPQTTGGDNDDFDFDESQNMGRSSAGGYNDFNNNRGGLSPQAADANQYNNPNPFVGHRADGG